MIYFRYNASVKKGKFQDEIKYKKMKKNPSILNDKLHIEASKDSEKVESLMFLFAKKY